MLQGITQVQQTEYTDKIFPTAMEWSEVFNSMWLKNIYHSKSCYSM